MLLSSLFNLIFMFFHPSFRSGCYSTYYTTKAHELLIRGFFEAELKYPLLAYLDYTDPVDFGMDYVRMSLYKNGSGKDGRQRR